MSLRYRRAILIYVGTIVIPVALFVWLIFQSFEQQRRTLQERTQQQVATLIKEGTDDAVREAFKDPDHLIIEYAFTMKGGEVIDPMLAEPLPDSPPAAFDEAERLEHTSPELALAAYRALLAANNHPALALWRIGRCLDKLGKVDDARATWRELAAKYPNDRDSSHRPFGILAAIAAHDTDGLYERIENGTWPLSAAQTGHFLEQLDATRKSTYLDRFAFAEKLKASLPSGTLGDEGIYQGEVDTHRIRYKSDGPQGIRGFSINERWIEQTLRPKVEGELDVAATAAADIRLQVGLLALIVLLLSLGVVLLLRDVSRETRTNQARAELVSSVSHELKTPITLVRLYSETLLRHRDFSEDDRLGFYRIIARESTRLGRLIDQVLTFSRVDRGSQVYHFEEGDITSVVSGVVDDYREYLEHAGFQLCCRLPPAVPPVRFDGAAVSQALVNLLDNAVKYSGTARDVAVSVAVDDRSVAIEVADRGVGIASTEQARIFDRFYRVPNGTGKGGYGLGLFLVKHIAEAHGGRAEVESEPGRGSRFRLVLPTVTPCLNPAS